MMLAFRLFHEPLPLERHWLLLVVPLVVVIAVVYKTIKIDDLSQLPRQSAWLSVQILFFLVLAEATLWLVTEYI